jgi:hypothetical protein
MRARFVNEELNEGYGQKDLVRMQDIKTKAAGNHDKEIQLATTQANIIKDAGKAKARSEAAEEVFGAGSDISIIFDERAKELGGSYVKSTASAGTLAPVKAPAGKGEKIEREFKTEFFLPSERVRNEKKVSDEGGFFRKEDAFKSLGIGRYATPPEIGGELKKGHKAILPLGKVNLGTGECKFFNIYETWDGTVEVWEDDKGNHKLVFTAGDKPLAKLYDRANFRHDQTGAFIGLWKLVDYVPVSKMRELIRVYGGSLSGYTYK